MLRQRVLQVVLVLFGLACLATLYMLVGALRDRPASSINRQDQMIMSIYVALGVFLLIAARNPAAHRSLVLFAGWSTLVHDGVMIIQGAQRHDLAGDAVGFAIIGVMGLAIVILATPMRSRLTGAA